MRASSRNAPTVTSGRGVDVAELGRLAGNHTAGGPLGLLLARLQGVRKAGKGYIARCPAHADKTASLSLCEGRNGAAVLHCFAMCPATDVLAAVGLQLADLYPERIGPVTPEHRKELCQYAKEARWKAALAVLAVESAVVEVAAAQVGRNTPLVTTDHDRLTLACNRIHAAREMLR